MSSIELRSSDLDQIDVGPLRAIWSARGDRVLRYSIDLRHKGLNLHRELSAPETFILQGKVDALLASWEDRFGKLRVQNLFRDGRAAADDATVQSQERLRSLARILTHTLTINDAVDWETLKDLSVYQKPASFPEPAPSYNPRPEPQYMPPRIGFFDILFGRKSKLLEDAECDHEQRQQMWREGEQERSEQFERDLTDWKERERQFWDQHAALQAEFEREQQEQNAVIDNLAAAVECGDAGAVVEHATLVLETITKGSSRNRLLSNTTPNRSYLKSNIVSRAKMICRTSNPLSSTRHPVSSSRVASLTARPKLISRM
jgi:restriction system protein